MSPRERQIIIRLPNGSSVVISTDEAGYESAQELLRLGMGQAEYDKLYNLGRAIAKGKGTVDDQNDFHQGYRDGV